LFVESSSTNDIETTASSLVTIQTTVNTIPYHNGMSELMTDFIKKQEELTFV
jgi:hypothetical protein